MVVPSFSSILSRRFETETLVRLCSETHTLACCIERSGLGYDQPWKGRFGRCELR